MLLRLEVLNPGRAVRAAPNAACLRRLSAPPTAAGLRRGQLRGGWAPERLRNRCNVPEEKDKLIDVRLDVPPAALSHKRPGCSVLELQHDV